MENNHVSRPSQRIGSLDGIRAVAVVLVLLFHLRVPHMGIGFIGVDVFFVLSGYLITSGLIVEYAREGGINLLEFWARRLRRLMPAAVLVVITVTAYAYLAARPYQRPDLGGDIWATILYIANWHFISNGMYFAVEPQVSLLHHMWSLSLEEQFYVAWPLWLFLILRLGGRLRLRPATQLPVVMASCTVLIGLSLLATAWWIRFPDRPDRPYMGTDAKAFEPLVGALLALSMSRPWIEAGIRRNSRALAWLAAVASLLLMIPLRHRSIYYQGGALVFCFAVALLIASLSVGAVGVIGRILGWRPTAYIGRISYGVYLWHWPAAVLTRAHEGFHPARALAAVMITGVCAALSYHVLERRFVERRMRGWRTAPATLRSTCLTVVGMLVLSAPLGGTWASPIAGLFGPPPILSKQRVMVVGDSAPYHLLPHLDRAARDRGITLVDGTQRGCSPLAVRQFTAPNDAVGPHCPEARAKQAERIAATNPGMIIWWSRYEIAPRYIASELVGPEDPRFWPAQERAFEQTVDRLAVNGAAVVVVLTERPSTGMRTRCGDDSCPPFLDLMTNHDELRIRWNHMVARKAARDPRVTTITIEDIVCPASNPGTRGDDRHLCDDSLPDGSRGRPDGTHVNPGPFGHTVAAALLDRARHEAAVAR